MHDLLHEVLDPQEYISESSSVMSIGTVVDIHDDLTVDIDIDGTMLLENIPVFYHCQGAPNTENGVYAFAVNDSVIVLHKKDDTSEPYIIGFADANIKLCRPPLIAGGYIDPSFEMQSVGRSLCFYDDGLQGCTPIAENYTYGQHTHFQVRYTKEPITFNVIETIEGVETVTPTIHDMVFSLAIYKGYHLNTPSPATIKNKIIITITDQIAFKIFRKEIDIDQFGLINETGFSANFNEDKTKLLIAYGDTPTMSGSPLGSISCIEYSIEILDNLEDITWTEGFSATHSFSRFVSYPYVDRDGKVWGLVVPYSDANGQQEDYYSIDFYSGDESAETKTSSGYTVIDGEFAGIFRSMATGAPVTITHNGFFSAGDPNPNNYPCNWMTYSPLVVDQVGVGNNCQSFPTPCGGPSNWLDDRTAHYWYSWNARLDSGNQRIDSTYYGESSITANSGITTIYDYNGESNSHQSALIACSNACSPGPAQCFGSDNEVIIANHKMERNTTERVTTIGGTITPYKDGIIKTWDKDSYTVFLRPLVCTYEDKCASLCQAIDPLVTTNYDDYMETIYPFAIPAASGVSSFIAWDNNENGLVIKGMVYMQDSESKLRVEINDIEITEELLTCTGFTQEYFHYLGFLF